MLCFLWCYQYHGRRLPLSFGGDASLPPIERKGVADMVTWQELFQFCLFIVALISLVLQANDNKKK